MSNKFEEIRLRNRNLTEQLLGLIGDREAADLPLAERPCPQAADAIVAHIEINDHHGVGVLVQRLFGDANKVLSVRSKDFYEGRQQFGAMHACIAHGETSRDVVVWKVLKALEGATVRRVLAIPYFPDDVLNAIAIKEAFGVPLCTFLMDDQNLCSDGISDNLMAELLEKSSLRLAISREMCTAYEAKYGCKVWFMPPLAPTRFIPAQLNELSEAALREGEPLILGNIWGQRWLELLRATVRGSGFTIPWFNNGQFRWLGCSREELASDGIMLQEGPPEPDDIFVQRLRRAPFVVLPSGTLDEHDDRKFIAQLSFPSRIPYILATSHTPILVLGNPDTAAARIVTGLEIGMVSPYRREEFLNAAARMCRPDVNLSMRRAAFLLSLRFADLGAAEWIWRSLEKGGPADGRFEEILPVQEKESGAFLSRFVKRNA